jgi:hypothetical protein
MLPAYRLFPIIISFFYAGGAMAYTLPAHNNFEVPAAKRDTAKTPKDTANNPPKTFELRPVLGLGTGMFSYFGAVTSLNSKLQNPMTSRIGYDLTYAQKITPVIEFNLYAVFGKLSVNERGGSVNWNFLSEIRGGGVHLLFKILPKQSLTPFAIIGAESFEYLTKTDMYDDYGNKYYYWSDGTVRGIPQNSPLANKNTPYVYRNYTYETDMRSLNLGNSGKYNLQTYAIPFGLGFMFHIGKKTDFLIGSTLHYTFTNHIDGYGDSIHSKKNDAFLMTSISLRFDITRKKKNEEEKGGYLPENLEGVDFAALMNDDYDQDGVRDWDDSCAGTPKGVKVDKKGCPIDGDHDGVPDYLDKQENSPPGAIVDVNGVALTDSAILMQYELFMDSTGQFAQIEIQNTIAAAAGTLGKNINYTIELGKFCKGVPPDVMDKLLSIPDVQSTTTTDSCTIYTVGKYNDFSVAKMRQQQLLQSGLPDARVVYKKGKDFVEATSPVEGSVTKNNNQVNNNAQQGNNSLNNNANNNNASNNNQQKNNATNNNVNANNNNVSNNQQANNQSNNNVSSNNNNQANNNANANNNAANTLPPTGNMVYRIQLGAYSHKLSRDVFVNINNLVEVKTENGFYTYSAGSYTNFQDAVNYKTELITQGFPDAFIKAYQNGKRVPLKDAGATFIQPTKEDMSEQVTHETSTLDKTQISFKVQVGVFRGTPPDELANRYKTMSNLTTDRDSTGMTHYLVGSYNDFNEAKNLRDKLAAEPALKGAFVVAYFKDKPIPLDQALSIMK